MARALWKGAISFGLVTIPVSLYPAKSSKSNLAFKMIDKRDMAPVHEKRVDESDHEVPWEEVVKGFEYEDGRYVVLGPEDFRAANVEASQTIDIMHFVDRAEIDVAYYDTPYYLEPQKQGRKAYALLRETLRRTGKVGVAKLVIRTRQHLCAVLVDGPMLMCEMLRWPYQLRSAEDFDVPAEDLGMLEVSEAELKMAEQLVDAMVAKWEPERYTDTYRDDLLKLIGEKVARGETEAMPEAPQAPEVAEAGKVVDIMGLLKRSLESQAGEAPPAAEGRPKEAGGDGHKGKKPARKRA